MIFRVYVGSSGLWGNEILVFDVEGTHEEIFFEDSGRNREDYDLTMSELPFKIESGGVHFEAYIEHN